MKDFEISPRASLVLAGLVILGLWTYFLFYEGHLENSTFMMSLGGLIVAALVFVSCRPFFSALFFASFVAIVAVTAYVKFEATTFALHMWDFVYYRQSWPLVAEWWRGRPISLAILAAGLLSLTLGSYFAWRIERPFFRRRWAAAGLAFFVGAASFTLWLRGERWHMQFNFPDWHVTSFLTSIQETIEALFRGGLIKAAPASEAAPFDPHWSCAPETKPPHIILIHQESVGPPMFFPNIDYDPVILPLFKSFDGQIRKLNVETFGGASWLTESAVLLGLASRYFGGMRDFIQFFMAGKLQDSLPQVLEKCGYRNVMFYPYVFGTFGNRRFFETIGVQEVFDRTAQGARDNYARDRFYYDNMLKFIDSHVRDSQRPTFIFLQTMAAHWPYDVAFEPDFEVPDGGDRNHPEVREYLRRLAMARIDLDDLKAQLKTRFPQERFLLLQYGDHHALPMSYALGYDKYFGVQNMNIPPGFPYFTTFYSVDGVNYTPPRLPDLDSVDTAFVGAIFLEAARIPLPESWRERLRLMHVCEGRAFECRRRDEMLKFHRRLIESGLMQDK